MKRIVLSTFSSALNHINAPHNVRLIPFHAIIDGKSMLDIAGFFANFFDIKPMWLDKKGHVTPFDLLPLLKQGDSQYHYWVFPNSTRLAYAD